MLSAMLGFHLICARKLSTSNTCRVFKAASTDGMCCWAQHSSELVWKRCLKEGSLFCCTILHGDEKVMRERESFLSGDKLIVTAFGFEPQEREEVEGKKWGSRELREGCPEEPHRHTACPTSLLQNRFLGMSNSIVACGHRS